MSAVETFEVNGLTVAIWQEEDSSYADPRDADNLGIMLAPGNRRYELGDKPYHKHVAEYDELEATLLYLFEQKGSRGLTIFARWLTMFYGSTCVLPLYLLDHSGLAMRTGPFREDPGGWDSGIVGFIFDTPKTREQMMGDSPANDPMEYYLTAEVRDYDAWLQGSVYGYSVIRKRTCDLGHEHQEVIDSCGGFLVVDEDGMDYVRAEARAAAEAAAKDDEGRAA